MWNGRCNTSFGCAGGTGDMSEPLADRAERDLTLRRLTTDPPSDRIKDEWLGVRRATCAGGARLSDRILPPRKTAAAGILLNDVFFRTSGNGGTLSPISAVYASPRLPPGCDTERDRTSACACARSASSAVLR